MTAVELLVVVIAEAETSTFLLLSLVETPDRPALHCDRGWSGRRGNKRRQQREARCGHRKKSLWHCTRWRCHVLIPQLKLARQAHGPDEDLWVVDLDIEAERGLETGGEEMDPLFLVQAACTRKERLEAILVLLDGARALARHQLTEGGWNEEVAHSGDVVGP
jgi:hypothetical protein